MPRQGEERHVDSFMSGEPAWEISEGFPEEVAFMLCLEKRGKFERGRKWGNLGKGRDVGNSLETSLHSRASPSPPSARRPGSQMPRLSVLQMPTTC